MFIKVTEIERPVDNLDCSYVGATAIDGSFTVCAYAERINRSGITAQQIGEAVFDAIERLANENKGLNGDDVAQVIVRFSHDT